MNLFIDAGNTRIKFGWHTQPGLSMDIRSIALLPDQLAQLPQHLIAAGAPLLKNQLTNTSAAWGVNVAGTATQTQIEQAVKALGYATTHWLSSTKQAVGVRSAYGDGLGTDRWVALLGLHAYTAQDDCLLEHPLLLASFGTATTIDTLSPKTPQHEREFPGGLILPGPTLMLQSLQRNTALLPLAQGESCLYPQDTLSAIISGVAASQAGAVLRQWQAGLLTYGRAPHVFFSGGGSELVIHELQHILELAYEQHGFPTVRARPLDTPVLRGIAYTLSVQQ